ncbi:glycosyltransferase family 4 protein [Flavobacterium sp.]|uniref:glycosyltransferase family 4 protein n=1 Tax=Flavobacterium sp. TaxID=239 RepID=UPI0039E471C2
MKFAIITQVPHLTEKGQYWSYAPYVREMNIWFKYVDEVIVVAPLSAQPKSAVDMAYEHPTINFREISDFNILNMASIAKTMWKIPRIGFRIFRAMQRADHIHLRCPGNIGLLGCFLQILFPGKPKTAKYAGNWDPDARQPWSYKWQRWILSNTFLTKNMQVLVYGQWPGSSQNIKPFFTATYKESDKVPVEPRSFASGIRLLFVGTLAPGKRPMYAVQLVEKLRQLGNPVTLEMYGEGKERASLESYISQHGLQDAVFLKGNQSEATVRMAYQQSHFLLLPSQSEGWPKVVAEAMFWGCLPVSSSVSCVPDMLGHGKRGVLLEMDLEKDAAQISALRSDQQRYHTMAAAGMQWSRQYTTDVFESSIRQLLQNSVKR